MISRHLVLNQATAECDLRCNFGSDRGGPVATLGRINASFFVIVVVFRGWA